MGYVSISNHSGLFFCAFKFRKDHCRYFVVSIVVPGTASEFTHRDIPDPKTGLPECNDSARAKKREFFPLPASKPGYFYRHAEDGIIDAGLLPVISTQEILALVLYRDGLFLGNGDIIELDEG